MIKLFFLICFFLVGCSSEELYSRSEWIMGTAVEIKVADRDMDREELDAVLERAFAKLSEIDELMSSFKDASDVGRINKYASERPVKVDVQTLFVIKKAKEYSGLTDGAFDITIAPLLDLWGFGKKNNERLPSNQEIDEVLELVNWKNLEIDEDNSTVRFLRKGMKIDLGGIAKGYAVDEAVKVLKEAGIEDALINAGGDIYALGGNRDREWRIGLQHPRKKKGLLSTISLLDRAVATSGDYENFFIIEGKRYSHILNPTAGYPQEESASVTVIAETAMAADVIATAISVIGAEKGMKLAESLENVEVIVVTEIDGKVEIRRSVLIE